MGIGIEKINLYAGSLVLDIEKLAKARNRDVDFFKNDLMIEQKSQNVDYEDVITMAVNAAKPIISEQDKKDIELCIFATESIAVSLRSITSPFSMGPTTFLVRTFPESSPSITLHLTLLTPFTPNLPITWITSAGTAILSTSSKFLPFLLFQI